GRFHQARAGQITRPRQSTNGLRHIHRQATTGGQERGYAVTVILPYVTFRSNTTRDQEVHHVSCSLLYLPCVLGARVRRVSRCWRVDSRAVDRGRDFTDLAFCQRPLNGLTVPLSGWFFDG